MISVYSKYISHRYSLLRQSCGATPSNELHQLETRDDTYLMSDSDYITQLRVPFEQGNSPESLRSETHQRETEPRYPSRVHCQPDRYDPS